jgi:hypothetical protein
MKIQSKLYDSIAYLVISVGFIFIAFRIFIICSHGTDLAGIEQNVVYSIQTLLDTGRLYFSPSDPPFAITQYTPIYYYICSFTAELLGYGSENIQAIYVIGRSWNLFFNLVLAFLVFKMSSRVLGISVNKSLFLSLLSFGFAFSHNFAVRPDSLHDLLGFASIYTFTIFLINKDAKRTTTGLLICTIFLTALATFSKQSGIQFIIIFSGFCFLNRDWKTLLKIVVLSAIFYGGFLLYFRLMYHSLLDNIVGGVANGISFENFIKFIITKNIFILSVWPLIFITLFLIFKNNSVFKGKSVERLLAITALGTLIFATATALKMGSTVQYFIVFINLALVFIFKYSSVLSGKPVMTDRYMKTKLLYGYFAASLLIYTVQDVKLILNFDYNPALERQRLSAVKTAKFINMNRVKNSGRYIFSNLTTDYTIASRQSLNNIFFRDCVIPQMDILEYSTGPSKVIGYNKLRSMLEDGEIEYLIESNPKSKFAILHDLEFIKNSNFKLIKKIDGYLIYKYYSN